MHFNRLPWRLRASPSTTRDEVVISTNADTMIYSPHPVKPFFDSTMPARVSDKRAERRDPCLLDSLAVVQRDRVFRHSYALSRR